MCSFRLLHNVPKKKKKLHNETKHKVAELDPEEKIQNLSLSDFSFSVEAKGETLILMLS